MNNFPPHFKSTLKIRRPCRDQVEMGLSCLDDKLPPGHKARRVWEFVESMNTDPLFEKIRSIQGNAGRRASDPQVMFALWLYGLIEGIASARRIALLTKEHDAYRWITGGVEVNHNNLSQFRSGNLICFHNLLTNSLAVLVKAGVLEEEDFSQDGTRVKAAAGFNTFRREETLQKLLKSAKQYMEEVEQLDPKIVDKQVLSSRHRAASERKERLEKALVELQKHREHLKESRNRRGKGEITAKEVAEVRASYVDPEARKMKMGDGGWRIAHNVQFSTGTKSRVIYGVHVVNTLDAGTLGPMILQVSKRLKHLSLSAIRNVLGDAAYSSKEDLEQVAALFPDVVVTAPSKVKADPKKHRKGDSTVVKDWRDRLETDEFKELYRQRPSSAEFSNMMTKNRGMSEFLVQGTVSVAIMTLLYAISHNMTRLWDLMT